MATGYLIPGVSRTGGSELNALASFLSGAVLAFGSDHSGISSSLILMYLGFYDQLLAAVTGLKLRLLAFWGVGFVVIALLMLKLVDYLFRRYRSFAYHGVVGVLFGFMVRSFPGFARGGFGLRSSILFSRCHPQFWHDVFIGEINKKLLHHVKEFAYSALWTVAALGVAVPA